MTNQENKNKNEKQGGQEEKNAGQQSQENKQAGQQGGGQFPQNQK